MGCSFGLSQCRLDTGRSTEGGEMKIGDLVKFRRSPGWLGIIVRIPPGTMELKTVEWVHKSGGCDRGAYAEKDLVLINENR